MTTVTKTYPEACRPSGPIPAAPMGGLRLDAGLVDIGTPAAS